jgi:hypothetical protein
LTVHIWFNCWTIWIFCCHGNHQSSLYIVIFVLEFKESQWARPLKLSLVTILAISFLNERSTFRIKYVQQA